MTSDYLGLPLQDFLGEVASPEPMPGAGYCAAISLSMAAGLVAMAAGASRGEWGEAKGAAAQANTLRERVAPLAQRNVAAYAERGRAAARSRRRRQPGSARTSGSCSSAPPRSRSRSREAAVDVASLAAVVAERGEQALRADAVAGALLAQGAARAAATLVEVNLATTSSDERVTRARDLAGTAAAAAEPRPRHARLKFFPGGKKTRAPPSGGRKRSAHRDSRGTQNGLPELDTEHRDLREKGPNGPLFRWALCCRGKMGARPPSCGRNRPSASASRGGAFMGYRN